MTWREQALCAQVLDDTIWFPDNGGPNRTAKTVCARCPVTTACLTWALDHHERHGIWAGTSEHERDQILRARRTPGDQEVA